MATYFGVTAGGNSSVAATWATSSGGTGGAGIPSYGDDIILDSNSGNITINAILYCRSLDCNSSSGSGPYASTLTHTTGFFIYIGTGSSSSSLVALRFSSTMAYIIGSNSGVRFVATTTTQQTITTAGKIFASVAFQGVGSSYMLVDGMTVNATGTFTFSNGTLNTNNQACSFGLFNAGGATTRTLTLGTSTITITGTGTAWSISTTTGLTLSATSSTINFTGTTQTALFGSSLAYGTVNFTGAGVQTATAASCSFTNFGRTGTAVKTDGISFSGWTSNTISSLALQGNSVTNRLLVNSSSIGTSVTLTASAITSLQYCDFVDIGGAGGAAPFTGTSLGDGQGNSGITFDAEVDQTWIGNTTGNWTTSAKWTSRVPLPQDNVLIPSLTNATITVDMPRMGKTLNTTGSTGGTLTAASLASTSLYGSLILSSGVTFNPATTNNMYLCGRSTYTIGINSAAYSLQTTNITAPGGSYTMTSNMYSQNFILLNGSFNDGGYDLTVRGGVTLTGSATRALIMSGIWNISYTSASTWNAGIVTGLTYTSTGSTIIMNNLATNFVGSGLTYNNVTVTGGSGASPITFSNNNTFNNLTLSPYRQVIFTAASINYLSQFSAIGKSQTYLTLPGITGNYASSPTSSALAITGNITADVYIAPASWYYQQMLISKSGAGSGTYSYDFFTTSTSALTFRVSANGTTFTTFTSSIIDGFAVNSAHWVRASLTLSNGTNSVCQFFTSSDGVNWTQLGSNVTGSTIASIYSSPAILELGSNTIGTANWLIGNYYEARIYNSALGSAAGTPVFDANFQTKPFGVNSFSDSSSNGATVTINGIGAQTGDGRIQLNSSTNGTAWTLSAPSGNQAEDYMVLQDSTATGGATWYAGSHTLNNGNNTGWTFSSYSTTNTTGFFGLF